MPAFCWSALGLVPDTGSTYFLGGLGPIGTFLALTNTRINGYQLMYVATHIRTRALLSPPTITFLLFYW